MNRNHVHPHPPRRGRVALAAGFGLGALALVGAGNAAATPPSSEPQTDGTALYSVDLDTGAATELGSVDGVQLVGVAIAPRGTLGTVYAITDANELATFPADDHTSVTVTPITGLAEGPLVGIDVRPATGAVFALSNDGVVYTINPSDATATAVGPAIDPTLEAAAFGFDFNPTVDRIRVGISTGQNLRLNPETGAIGMNPDTGEPTIDGLLLFADGDPNVDTTPRVVGAAYTNSVAGATETQLFVIDAATGSLALQNPPNDGVLNTVGDLGVDLSDAASFDIAPSGESLLAVPSNAFGTAMPAPATQAPVAVAGPSGDACAVVPSEGEGSFVGMADDPAATAASNNPQLASLTAAVEAAGLTDTLNGDGPFTIFAPNNSAFAKIPEDALAAALADPTGLLTDILTLHVVSGQQLSSADLLAAGTVETLGGTLTIGGNGSSLTVDAGGGPSAIICADIPTANATVHIIDTVLSSGS
jgi:uncharacterized surface protein with fasciclin (FAS1) repeats